jgi:hypothetical protein
VEGHAKLTHHIVDFDQLETSSEHWAGHDIVFHCLGTTRGAAGGAAGFYQVEVDFTRKVAEMTAESGIRSISVVTAQGANPSMPRVDLIHPMLYAHSLGKLPNCIHFVALFSLI